MIGLKKSCGRRLQRVIAVISLLCLLLSFGAVTAKAEGIAKVTISSCTVERGASVSVDFNLEGNPGIWGLKLRIHYDQSALTLNSVTAGSVFEKGELMLSENLNKNPYIVVASGNELENKTANGTIVTLNFTVNNTAECKGYPITVEVSQANNVSGDKVHISAVDGGVTVVSCAHEDKEWRVTSEENCEEAGTETETCKKCGATFETRTINATGHQHTEVRNAAAATKTAEGYTGDIYCIDCGKQIAAGRTIAKLEEAAPVTNPPESHKPTTGSPDTTGNTTGNTVGNTTGSTEPSVDGQSKIISGTVKAEEAASVTNPPGSHKPVTGSPDTPGNTTGNTAGNTTGSTEPSVDEQPKMISGANSVFQKQSKEPLVFISSADFSKFIRVEIDGTVLDEKKYTVEEGSTVVTIKAECLNKLSDGQHTVSIISESGTVAAQFTIQTPAKPSAVETMVPIECMSAGSTPKSSAVSTVIVIIVAVLLAGGAGALFAIKGRRG